MSSVREKIEKGIEALECLDQTFTEIAAEERGFRSGAEYGYRLAIEELHAYAKDLSPTGQVRAGAIAEHLMARLEGR